MSLCLTLSDIQDDDTVQCSVAMPTATEPEASDDTEVAAEVNINTDKVSDSWKMESLSPPPALLQPPKYHPLHIFVSCF